MRAPASSGCASSPSNGPTPSGFFRCFSLLQTHTFTMLNASKQSSAALLPPPEEIHNLCAWLDRLPLSRPKRHLARDFSDGGASEGEAQWGL